MPNTTLSRGGEYWDQIALRCYGAERYLSWLMGNNLPLAHIYRFAPGVIVNTPPIQAENMDLPPWRR